MDWVGQREGGGAIFIVTSDGRFRLAHCGRSSFAWAAGMNFVWGCGRPKINDHHHHQHHVAGQTMVVGIRRRNIYDVFILHRGLFSLLLLLLLWCLVIHWLMDVHPASVGIVQ